MKRVFGAVAVVLGTVGGLASLAGAIGVWPATNHYAQEAVGVCTQLTQTVESTEAVVDPLQSRIEKVTAIVEAKKEALQKVAAEGDGSDPADRAEVEALLTELSARVAQAQQWTETLRSSSSSLSTVLKLAAGFTRNPQQREKLQATLQALEKIEETLGNVEENIARATQEENLQTKARNLASVASKLAEPLSKLNTRVTDVSTFLSSSREEVEGIKQRIEVWKLYIPGITTGVLIWMALGQFFLLRAGWQSCRSEPSAN